MRIVNAKYEILNPHLDEQGVRNIYKQIELAGRTCYKSEDKITEESAERFARALVKNGHEAMLEHASIMIRFTVDRGVSHELVRHRLASFAQESTRYCNYSMDKFGKEITVIEPCFFNEIPDRRKGAIMDLLDGVPSPDDILCDFTELEQAFGEWYFACSRAEASYFYLLENGLTPQEARSVLPTSVKTEVVMTMNMRELRHFLKLRAAGVTGKPHPQMLEVAMPLLIELKGKLPALFYDIEPMN